MYPSDISGFGGTLSNVTGFVALSILAQSHLQLVCLRLSTYICTLDVLCAIELDSLPFEVVKMSHCVFIAALTVSE
jgi:hypothetical protein